MLSWFIACCVFACDVLPSFAICCVCLCLFAGFYICVFVTFVAFVCVALPVCLRLLIYGYRLCRQASPLLWRGFRCPSYPRRKAGPIGKSAGEKRTCTDKIRKVFFFFCWALLCASIGFQRLAVAPGVFFLTYWKLLCASISLRLFCHHIKVFNAKIWFGTANTCLGLACHGWLL